MFMLKPPRVSLFFLYQFFQRSCINFEKVSLAKWPIHNCGFVQ